MVFKEVLSKDNCSVYLSRHWRTVRTYEGKFGVRERESQRVAKALVNLVALR